MTLLSTVGSLGDLYPVLSVALALRRKGAQVRLAVSPDQAEIARERGLDVVSVGPTEDELGTLLGLSRNEIAAQIFRNPSPILNRATYPLLPDLVRTLLPHVRSAQLVAGTFLAMAAPLAAERAAKPFAELILQPMLLRSILDPPRVPGFAPPMVRGPKHALSRGWNRAWIGVVDTEFRRRHTVPMLRARRSVGLPFTSAVPLWGQAVPPVRRIGLWDPVFSPVPPDAPDVNLAGFPEPPHGDPLPADLLRFLEAGSPPLVVSLGSVAQSLGGPDFYHRAVALARGADLRVVCLAGNAQPPVGPDVFTLPYANHEALFPKAAAILHHGGIGTSGAALRAGRPQIVLPLGADQPDNAARLEGMGVAIRVSPDLDVDLAGVVNRRLDRPDLLADAAGRAADLLIRATG